MRVFLETDGERTPAALRDALKSGRTFVSNGPLLGLDDRRQAARRHARERAGKRCRCASRMRSPFPVDHLELVQNGRVIKTFKLAGDRTRFDWSGDVDAQGGRLARAARLQRPAASLGARPLSLRDDEPDLHRRAGAACAEDAAYFVAWMDRVIEAAAGARRLEQRAEKADTLDYLNAAREKFRALAATKKAN